MKHLFWKQSIRAKKHNGNIPIHRYKPEQAISNAPNWLIIHPDSLMTDQGQTILEYLGAEKLWRLLKK
jgi:hypothetical protein